MPVIESCLALPELARAMGACMQLQTGSSPTAVRPRMLVCALSRAKQPCLGRTGNPSDVITIKSLDVKPDPPRPGEKLTIYASGTVHELVDVGAALLLSSFMSDRENRRVHTPILWSSLGSSSCCQDALMSARSCKSIDAADLYCSKVVEQRKSECNASMSDSAWRIHH